MPDPNDLRFIDESDRSKKRTKRFTRAELEILRNAFEENPKPPPEKYEELARLLGHQPQKVRVYFANRRAQGKVAGKSDLPQNQQPAAAALILLASQPAPAVPAPVAFPVAAASGSSSAKIIYSLDKVNPEKSAPKEQQRQERKRLADDELEGAPLQKRRVPERAAAARRTVDIPDTDTDSDTDDMSSSASSSSSFSR